MPEKLTFATCRTGTPYGEIVSAWKREGAAIRWNVTVPWNTTATVKLPQFQVEKITLNGKSVAKNEFEVTSGKWEITLNK